MRFRVLGSLEVTVDGSLVELRAAMLRRLLAALLSHAGEPVGTSALIDALWSADPPVNAVKTTQIYIYRLRQELGDPSRIVRGPGGYTLALRTGELDAHEFVEFIERAREVRQAGDLDRALDMLERALQLWHGRPYDDLADCEFLGPEVQRLTEWRLRALEDRCAIRLDRGRHDESIPELSALVAENPYRERLAELLMLALYRSGRQADALALFLRTRKILDEELGIEPGARLRNLHEAILRRDSSLDSPVSSATFYRTEKTIEKTSDRGNTVLHPAQGDVVVPAQLPFELASLTGRGRELDSLAQLADSSDHNVVVGAIHGMAGSGKTALAVSAGHRLAPRFPDGQLFLDLHGFTEGVEPVEPGVALDRLLRAMGVGGDRIPHDVEDRAALWRSCLSGKKILIVLDNAATEGQVRALLPGMPGCLLLVTSRRQLSGLDDLHPVSLEVLSGEDAIGLFVSVTGADRVTGSDRVTGVGESLALLTEVVELCGRLPLAIRLVASRFRDRPSWRLSDLVSRLRGRQLAELEAGERSVARAFQLSYDQVIAEEQRLFRLLGLHPGVEFDDYAAAALLDVDRHKATRLLEELTDLHLLEPRGYGRFTFHDLLRKYARQVAERDEPPESQRVALDRLFDYYVLAASKAMAAYAPEEERRRPRPAPIGTPSPSFEGLAEARSWLDTEQVNLLAVSRVGRRRAIDLGEILDRYLQYGELRTAAIQLNQSALRIARAEADRLAEAMALRRLGLHFHQAGRNNEALQAYQSAVGCYRDEDDFADQAALANNYSAFLFAIGDVGEALTQNKRALALYKGSDERIGASRSYRNLGLTNLMIGRLAEAGSSAVAALELAREANSRSVEGDALRLCARVNVAHGRHEEALELATQASQMCESIGYRLGVWLAECAFGMALHGLGRYAEASDLFAEIARQAEQARNGDVELEARIGLGTAHLAAGQLDPAHSELARALELALELAQPYDEALARQAMGRSYLERGEIEAARSHWERSAALYRDFGAAEAAKVEAALASLESR